MRHRLGRQGFLLLAIALALLTGCVVKEAPPRKTAVIGMDVGREVERMNNTDCKQETWSYHYELDWVSEGLIVAHNQMYMVVFEPAGEEWRVSALFNPDDGEHFRMMEGVNSGVSVDPEGRRIAVTNVPLLESTDVSGLPIYLCHIDSGEVETYSSAAPPAGISLDETPANRLFTRYDDDELPEGYAPPLFYNGDGTLEWCAAGREGEEPIFMRPFANTDIYLLDEHTAVYRYSPHLGFGRLGDWRLCFFDFGVSAPEQETVELEIR